MPRYFFNLYNDIVSMDQEGAELPDDDAARVRAIKSARDIAAAEVQQGRLNLSNRIEVQDETGRTVTTITFREAVKLSD